jgi:hypothetical protein
MGTRDAMQRMGQNIFRADDFAFAAVAGGSRRRGCRNLRSAIEDL